jgi:hypothetical protein
MFVDKARAYLQKHISGVPLLDRLLVLSIHIGLDWKGLPWTNTGLLQTFVNCSYKKFYEIGTCLTITGRNGRMGDPPEMELKIREAWPTGKDSIPLNS